MAAPNVNGCLHLTGVHRKPPASLDTKCFIFYLILTWEYSAHVPHDLLLSLMNTNAFCILALFLCVENSEPLNPSIYLSIDLSIYLSIDLSIYV